MLNILTSIGNSNTFQTNWKRFASLRSLSPLALAIIALISACQDPTSILPPGNPPGALITDTFQINAWTVRDDSTYATNLVENVLGSEDDPVFGKTVAGFYTQLTLPRNEFDFVPDTGSTSYIFDSAVMVIRLTGFYGDPDIAQDIDIWTVTEQLEGNTIYNADREFTLGTQIDDESQGSIIAKPSDSVTILDVREPPELRIRIDQSWAETNLFNNSGETAFDNDSTFRDLLPAIYVTVDSLSGYGNGFSRVNLQSVFSRLALYYRATYPDTAGVLVTDTLAAAFPITTGAVTIGHYEHNFQGSEAADYIRDPMTDPTQDSILFIKSLGGLKAKIEIPNLEDLPLVAINRATLRFGLTHGTAADTVKPAQNISYVIQSDSLCNNSFFFIDRSDEIYWSVRDQLEGDIHYGGFTGDYIDPSTGLPVDGYEVNLTREFQAVLNGTIDNDDYLIIPFPYFRLPHRSVIGSHNRTDAKRMHLEIVYTLVE